MTTTKIYQADVFKHREMNEQSEHFRKITMKVLTMQLNSITIMDLPEPEQKNAVVPKNCSVKCRNLCFSYEADREILHNVNMDFLKGSFTAIVGESGCGKSTIAAILMGRNKEYTGKITVGEMSLSEIREDSLMENFTYISHQSYLFKGTVRENLLMAQPDAEEDTLWR